MDEHRPPQTIAELGVWLKQNGVYLEGIANLMVRGQWPQPPAAATVDWQQLAVILPNPEAVADALTALVLAREPMREGQDHPLAEYVAEHPDPAGLAVGLAMLVTMCPGIPAHPLSDLLAGVATMRAAATPNAP